MDGNALAPDGPALRRRGDAWFLADWVDATFVQHCGSPDGPATRGEVHFHA